MTLRRALWALTVGLVLAYAGAASAAPAGVPAVSGSSITAESLVLVYGTNFEDPALRVNLQIEPSPKPDAKPPTDAELTASLERVLAGQAQWPAEPGPKDPTWHMTTTHQDNVLATDALGSTGASQIKIMRVRNSVGVSAPYVLNRPEIWGLSPHRLCPGQAATVWGPNVGWAASTNGYSWFGVVNDAGKVVTILKGYFPSQNQQQGRVQEFRFYRSILLPADLAPGTYKLYCWNGFGDVGWSEAGHALTVGAPPAPRPVVEVKQRGAVGDGETDDTAAFDQALAEAAKTGGKVLVAPGQYLLSHTLALPEGVSLVGMGSGSCTLLANPYKPFTGEIPQSAVGPDAQDWFRGHSFANHMPLVWVRSHTGVENLTLDAGQALQISGLIMISDPKGGNCVAPVVRNCRLLTERAGLYDSYPHEWSTGGLLITSSTEDLVLEDTYIRGSAEAVRFYPGTHRGARLIRNTFTVADAHDAVCLVVLHGESQECLFENNLFIHGGRGKSGGAFGNPGPTHDLWLHNTFQDLWKGDGEILMYETGTVKAHGVAASSTPTTLTATGTPAWKPDKLQGGVLFLTSGPGIGQFRTVTANDAGSLTVDKPWRIAPDATSNFIVMAGAVQECLHVGNEFYRCHCYCGIYGCGVRNVWVNEIYEDVTGGLFLWAIHGPRSAQFLNLLYVEKFNSRAGILFPNGRWANADEDAPTQDWELHRLKVFGNEVRWCAVRDRSYVSSENGGVATGHMWIDWASKGNSLPLDPVPGTEAGICFFDQPTGWFSGPPTDPLLDTYNASTDWNLILENQISRCPVGIELGKAVDHTILWGNTCYQTPTPVLDLAHNTLNVHTYVAQDGKPVPSP